MFFYDHTLPCAGNAGLPPLNLYARVRISLHTFARETAGAACTGIPCSLCFEGETGKTRTQRAAGTRGLVRLETRHCEPTGRANARRM